MPSWKKVIVSGSNAALNSLNVTNGVTGSLFGTASYSTSASQALTASYSNYALTSSNSQNAQDLLIYVKNTSGAQINKGTVVRISGATGDNALISTASYESDGVSANTLGITNQNIPNDSFGYVITEGTFIGFDTSTPGWIAGQLLYLGANGTITGSAPQAPLHAVRLGQVLRVQSVNGSMYVRIDNGYELGELHDVVDNTTTSSYGDLLVKSGSVWINSRQLTGSYGLTGSLQATSFTGSFSGSHFGPLTGTASYATQALSASFSSTSSFLNSTTNAFIQNGNSFGTTAILGTNDSQPLVFETNTSERMRITATGDVGIGTTSPSARLHVDGNMYLQNSATGIDTITFSNGPQIEANGPLGYFKAGEVYSNTTSQNVGVKTSTPTSASLTVNGNVWATSYTGSLFGTASYATSASQAISSSFAVNASSSLFATSASQAISSSFAINASSSLFAVSSSRAISASFATVASSSLFATSASQAVSASFAVNASSSLRAVSSSFATLAASATTATTANSTVAAATFNNGGAGDVSGTTFNGGTARTISYNTVGAPSTSGTNATGTWGISITGNAATATSASYATVASSSLFATSASQAASASFVNTLNQNIIVTGSAAIGATSGASENTLTLGARDNGSEGGQLGFNSPGGVYTSASMLDNYQNRFRILRGTNAGSDAEIAWWSMHTKQMALPAYTGSGAFPGTTTGILGVDSSGNIITTTAGGTGTVTQVNTSGTVNGLTLTGGPIISTGTITLGGTLSNILTSSLAQSGSTIGSTFVGLGSTVTTLAGLSSVTSTNFTGTASYATSASQAISSSFAVNASSSLRALTANSATSATSATSASYATIASSSLFATTAGTATSATSADTVKTSLVTTNATYYLTYVPDNNMSPTAESLGTVGTLTFNPNTGVLAANNFTGTSSYATSASQAISSSYATIAQSVLGSITNASTASNITPAITNAADNRVLTANGGGTINGEQNLTFDGTTLIVVGKLENGDSGCVASGNESHAEGRGTLSKGDHSHAEGYGTTSDGIYSHAEGYETYAGINAHSEGYITSASGVASHTEGSGSRATGVASHAEGYITLAAGFGSHAEGDDTKAIGNYSHAEGRRTSASNYWDHAEGEGTIASGIASHAEGYGSLSTATYSHAEGYQSFTAGQASHAEGLQTSASNSYAHSEGWRTRALGLAAHSEGQYTTASGDSTHAEGDTTLAIGQASHAEGSNTISVGIASHAAGYYTSASGNYQSVIGQYNIPIATDSTFIIGNGTGVGARSNLLYASGSQVQITGSLVVTGGITGSFSGTTTSASYANIASSSLFATTAGTATSASFTLSASYADNASSSLTIKTNGGGSGTFYPLMQAGASSGYLTPVFNSSFNYSGTTNTLTAGTFAGALSGNASTATSASYATVASSSLFATTAGTATTATNATNVAVTDTMSGTGPYYLMFADGTTGNRAVRVDSSTLTFDATANTLTVANLTGTASYATSASQAVSSSRTISSSFAISSSFSVSSSFAARASSSLFASHASSSGLATNALQATSANSATTATSASMAVAVGINDNPSSGGGPFYVPFVASATGNATIQVDSSTFIYAPSTNTLTVANLTGTASYATSASQAISSSFSEAARTVGITTQDTTPVTYNITFTGGSSGNSNLNVDATTLTYNPSTSTFTTPIVNSTTAIQGGNGSGTTPAFSFSGDTNTGMYNAAADHIGFSVGGVPLVIMSASGLHMNASGTKTLEIGAGSAGDTNLVFTPNSTGGTGGNINVNHNSLPLIFKLNSVERARITNGGAMGLGVTPTNTAGRFEASNDVVAFSSSDKNWKKNIKNIDSPLEKLSQINGVEFDWIEDEPIHGNKGHDIGIIAQEIEQILPEIVQTRESGMKAVQYDKIIPLLIEAIKDQQKQIEELKSKIK